MAKHFMQKFAMIYYKNIATGECFWSVLTKAANCADVRQTFMVGVKRCSLSSGVATLDCMLRRLLYNLVNKTNDGLVLQLVTRHKSAGQLD